MFKALDRHIRREESRTAFENRGENRIVLSLKVGGWVATYTGPHADDVMRAFGTNVLPTAFTYEAQASLVKAEIMKLNPDCVVEVKS